MARVEVPSVDTERLRLRPWRDDDLDAYAAISADPQVMRHLGHGGALSRPDAWRQMAMFTGHWQLKGFGTWAVEEKDTGHFVGRIGLHEPEGWPGVEVGWTLAREVWGRGYASEGGRAALQYAWDVLRARHVISLIIPENTASIRVAERLGETFEREWVINEIPVHIYGVDRPT